MNNLGEQIKQKRIEKGMSIEDLSNRTLLSPAIIKDIENGAFDRYEGDEAYVKMYLKKISDALDMDREEVTQSYIALTEEIKKEELEEARKRAEMQEAERESRPKKEFHFAKPFFTSKSSVYEDKSHLKVIRIVIVLLLIVLIVAVAWIGLNSLKPADKTYTNGSDKVTGQVETKKKENTQNETEKKENTEEKNKKTADNKITFTRKSKLNYNIKLPSGSEEFTFKVTFGNRTFASLRVNGKAVADFQGKVYSASQEAQVKLKVKEFKTLTLHLANNHGAVYYINDTKITLSDDDEKHTGATDLILKLDIVNE